MTLQMLEKYLLNAHYELTLMGTGDRMMNKAQFIVRGMELAPGTNQLRD